MKAIIYIPIKDISKKVEDLSEWYTTTDQLSNNKIKSLVQIIIDTDTLVNMIDNNIEYISEDEMNKLEAKYGSEDIPMIYERNPDTGQIRSRKFGDYGNEVYHGADKGDEDMDEGEHKEYSGPLFESFPEYKDMTLGNFQGWYSKLNDQDKARFNKLQRGVQENKRK